MESSAVLPDDASTEGRRAAVLVIGASAYALYLVAYTGAIRLSMGLSLGSSLLAGLANSIPDLLAAPLVLRVAATPSARGRAVLRLALLAPAFVGWSLALTTLGLAAIRGLDAGIWRLSFDPRGGVWKALLSLLVFGVLAGVGRALLHAREAREASTRALRAETLRAEARLAVLRAQLNPHFILNVLHSLVGLAERDPKATAAALERLGTTLRYAQRVQGSGSDRVALRDELAFTREYLELERLRLGDRLETRFQVDEAQLGRVVPPFVLQPLVENAIQHAIAPRARGGVVSIGIEGTSASGLRIRVEDDGSSGPTSAQPEPDRQGGLGLRLLRERLDALYRGGDGTLEIDRSPLGGLRATLCLVGEPSVPEDAE